MNNLKTILCALTLIGASAFSFADASSSEISTKEFVLTAFNELFVDGDLEAIDRYWAEDYIQRNPNFPSGREVIKELFGNMPPNFKYEIGMVKAEDDLVAIHARVTGFGPKPMILVDIIRVEDGKIAEHWDVLQEEVLETASGNAMFEPMEK